MNIDCNGIPQVFYKYDNSKPGWYPKPIEIEVDKDMQRTFKHDDPEFGEVLKYKENAGIEMGKKQTWFYDVTYANGKLVTFPIKCISLPLNSKDVLIDLNNILPQVFRGKIIDDTARESILNNIIKLLTNRHLNNDIENWRDFFRKLPVNEGYVFSNTILNLVNRYKRAVQVS